jgi:polysaccharide deacetylase 2 family uncharacterized protein YibQ
VKKTASNVFAVIIIAAALGAAFYKFYYVPRAEKNVDSVKKTVDSFVAGRVLIDPLLIISRKQMGVYDLTARMPERYTAESLQNELETGLKSLKKVRIKFSRVETDRTISLTALIETPYKVACKLRFIKDKKPKIALILDDWGYKEKDIPYLASIKQIFTISILPNNKFSAMADDEAYKYNKGIMLHLPMEPEKKTAMEKTTILADMGAGTVKGDVSELIAVVPHLTGVNNHEGSLATSKKEIMIPVLEVLRDNNLFFIDSLTSPKTVGYKTAESLGVRWGKRDVFIDNEKKAPYVKDQLNKLAKLAKSRGWAIAIGHDDPVTLSVLARMMPELESQGIEFVYPAELMR